ncbi:MAG: SusD/RagB family nutrient-binding outer membrane lipoprotein [Flavisolibacter sp.]|nr:SusD/RagB family nutrient-binding outer membrane lipoprotein [Flavisolibacter sp.]
MKKMNKLMLFSLATLLLASCDKNFKEINTNPQQIKNTDAGYLFSNALLSTPTWNWQGESTIVQQFVLPYNQGVTLGYQFNESVDGINNGPFGVYTGSLKHLEHILVQLKSDTARTNLFNMARIWRAYCYMYLVDHYGDVPYTESGKAALEGVFYPKYDKDEVIYEDLYKEIKEATGALNPTKDNNTRYDIFTPGITSTAGEVAFWKKLGYSLLFRLGMRYSKLDANKAKAIVQEAYNGGLIQSNNDNVYIRYNNNGAPITGYSNGAGGIRTSSYFYYAAKPFVDKLKSFGDPRLKYYVANYYPDMRTAPSVTNPDTTTANQFGFPVGESDATIVTSPFYRPNNSGKEGQNYSQVNYNTIANALAPVMLITNAQTKFLLAEAAFRGWLPAGAQTAQQYYEAGVRASMDELNFYPNVLKPAAIPTTLQDAYLAQSGVAWNPAKALELINTQYWIANFNNGYEAWSNFRRTGYPVLTPNSWNTSLNGGFIRRFAYPLRERDLNYAHYAEAVASLGGPDNLTTRIFWDTP